MFLAKSAKKMRYVALMLEKVSGVCVSLPVIAADAAFIVAVVVVAATSPKSSIVRLNGQTKRYRDQPRRWLDRFNSERKNYTWKFYNFVIVIWLNTRKHSEMPSILLALGHGFSSCRRGCFGLFQLMHYNYKCVLQNLSSDEFILFPRKVVFKS